MGAVALVSVFRSGLQESRHLGHIAVCDADGLLVAWAGDPDHVVFARSCMKPLQAAVSLQAVGHGLPDRELAVMCASHNGEPVHIAAVRTVLERAGLDSEALRNPPGWPIDKISMARAMQPNREMHDCSGKHAGMLLACVRAGWNRAEYLSPEHPLQRRVLDAVGLMSRHQDIAVGVDGCGLPVHGLPLMSMATLYARLAASDGLGDLGEFTGRAVEAMRAEPYMVGGRDRLDTDVMLGTADVLAKEGAEAIVCASLLSAGLGVAIKIADGGRRATAPALVQVLAQLDALTPAAFEALAVHARPPVLGGGKPVGELVAGFELQRKR
jgi:L-asparaginase II